MTNQGIEFVNIPIKFSLYNSNGEKDKSVYKPINP